MGPFEKFLTDILELPTLETKLANFELSESSTELIKNFNYTLKDLPARPSHLQFSDQNIKFPRPQELATDKGRAKALHFFANHELIAIEMLAAAILLFPCSGEEDEKFRKKALLTLKDEQKHFRLYQYRMEELGIKFGDYPLNGFFWKYMTKIKSIDEFCSTLSLTFEAANLDFAFYYHDKFLELGDEKSAKIMKTVLDDEIKHVQYGYSYFSRNLNPEQVWKKYLNLLPAPLSPARSKGINYQTSLRIRAGLPSVFLDSITKYDDNFRVTKRKARS